MDQSLINRIVEAALLASNQPLTLAQLHGLFPEEEPAPPGSVERALEVLGEACAERGVELVEVASGFRFQVKADVHAWVARLWTERKTRYTRATLETLALIAYRQPITRGEIEQVRGVAVSSNIIQALEEREWIRVIGHRDVPGKPALFGTTKIFLDYFGLKRLDELPPLSELKDIGELEPQLPLDSEGQPAAPLTAGALLDAAPGTGDEAADATPAQDENAPYDTGEAAHGSHPQHAEDGEASGVAADAEADTPIDARDEASAQALDADTDETETEIQTPGAAAPESGDEDRPTDDTARTAAPSLPTHPPVDAAAADDEDEPEAGAERLPEPER